MLHEFSDFLIRTERPAPAGIFLLAILLIQPAQFAAETTRRRPLTLRAALAGLFAALAAACIWIPGVFFLTLAPLLVCNIYLWRRHRRYTSARKALEQEVETNFLDHFGRTQIETMIGEVEKVSGAELKVIVEVDYGGDPEERAQAFFRELEMDRTQHGTGVIFYFAIRQKRFAVFGSLPPELAAQAVKLGEEAFGQAKFADGIVAMIGELIDHLAEKFPRRPDDKNEISDRVIVVI